MSLFAQLMTATAVLTRLPVASRENGAAPQQSTVAEA
jgi:hypothetical protein